MSPVIFPRKEDLSAVTVVNDITAGPGPQNITRVQPKMSRPPLTDKRKVVEIDKLSGREFDRTKYANDWVMKQGTQQTPFGKSLKGTPTTTMVYQKTLEDYVEMKNLEHQGRRRDMRMQNKIPDTLMVYEIRDV